MKRLALLLIVLLLATATAPASLAAPQTLDLDTMSIEELHDLLENIQDRIADQEAGVEAMVDEEPDDVETTPAQEAPAYDTLQKGSNGNAVKELQQRLIDLKYLTGKADGGYGNMTGQAVTDFQKAVGITPSGVADNETQTALFADDAKENPNPPFDPSIYEKMNYKAIARDPDAFNMKLITFTGKVIQVIEGDDSEVQYRIATSGSYNDVVYVVFDRPEGASRILDDDRVTVYGICLGTISYDSTMGGKITIPACMATQINLR